MVEYQRKNLSTQQHRSLGVLIQIKPKAGISGKILDKLRGKKIVAKRDSSHKKLQCPSQRVSLSDFTSFLYEMKTSGYPFEINSARFVRKREKSKNFVLRQYHDIRAHQHGDRTMTKRILLHAPLLIVTLLIAFYAGLHIHFPTDVFKNSIRGTKSSKKPFSQYKKSLSGLGISFEELQVYKKTEERRSHRSIFYASSMLLFL